ncbi:hypothetical protein GYA19_03870 [Candidatus Beckwithbacteria bacterium]|nr:hypothetical protein [Candidatus Beckwithbacteria bacterium]
MLNSDLEMFFESFAYYQKHLRRNTRKKIKFIKGMNKYFLSEHLIKAKARKGIVKKPLPYDISQIVFGLMKK